MDGSQSRGYNFAAMLTEPPIACNLNVLNDTERDRRAELTVGLRSAVREIITTSDHEIFDRPCGVANGPEPRDQTFASVKVPV
jgi:hypothetical protein